MGLKKECDIAFVILHYQTVLDTINCIESIKTNIDTENYLIVVVDNFSPNKSGEKLQIQYRNDNFVKVITTRSNLGFARGNNVGIDYIRDSYKCKYIVCSNNDILLFQNNLLMNINKIYSESSFAVLGPMILTEDGKYISNPLRVKPFTKEEYIRRFKLFKIILFCYENLFIYLLGQFFKKIYNIIFKRRKKQQKYLLINQEENVVIHGSFLIFSEKYFLYFSGFNDKTFMYLEEEILYEELTKRKLKMVYSPQIVVYHKSGCTTDEIYKGKRKRTVFFLKNVLDSSKILFDVLANNNIERP